MSQLIALADVRKQQVLNGASAFINGQWAFDCPLKGTDLNDWIEGYVFFAICAFRRNPALPNLFHGKQLRRVQETYNHAELQFLSQAWPAGLSVEWCAELLQRNNNGIRIATHTLGIKRDPLQKAAMG